MGSRVASVAPLLGVVCLIEASAAAAEPKPLNRSIYMPVEFLLCEHLEHAVLYQEDLPISAMPAKRMFQFTYYPHLGQLLPASTRVRVEGTYVDGGEPFVARLLVTPDGVHTTHRTVKAETDRSIQKQSHRIDVRLEPRQFRLACPRYCRKANTVAPEER